MSNRNLVDLFFRERHCDWAVLRASDRRTVIACCKACGKMVRAEETPTTCAVDDLLNRRTPA